MTRFSRRQFLATTATASAVLALPNIARADGKTLTIVSWGGAYQKAQSEEVWQPAAKKLGIELIEETYNGLADIRLRVRSGAVSWDIVSIGAGGAARAAAEDLLTPIDYSVVQTENLMPDYASKNWLGGDLYSTVLPGEAMYTGIMPRKTGLISGMLKSSPESAPTEINL